MPQWRALWFDPLIFALVSLSFASSVLTTRVNVTVDDSGLGGSLPQITYAPPGGWNAGNNCSACTAHPSPGEAFAGTWHDTTFPANGTANDLKTASLVFNGSAIYVFCILAHSFTSPTSTSDMTFYLDGQVVGHFLSVPDGDTTYDYNVPVYSNALLTPGSHSFTLQGGRVGGSKSLVLLDYIVYSQDLETPTATQPFPTDSNVGISTIPHSTNSSTFGSSISSSNSTQLRDSQDMSPSHARTIAIATAVPICVIVLAISVVGVLLYRRKRNSERSPYPHNPPMEPNITEDPSSSGWVEGAFGRQEGSGVFEHPSLTPKGSVPEALRGDPNTRGAPKYRRERSHTESSSASARRSSIRPGRSGSAEPPSSSSVAIEMTKMSRSGRHPYAAPTPEPDIEPIVDESDPGQPSSSVAEDSSLAGPSSVTSTGPLTSQAFSPVSSAGSPATASSPGTTDSLLTSSSPRPITRLPARQRSGSRPLPMRPVLESQAHAARLRRQNSRTATSPTSLPSSTEAGEEAPPSYEASRDPHRRIF